MSEERRARAAARNRLPGARVLAKTPKPLLYEELSAIERLEAMQRLCTAQWLAANPPPEKIPRSEWPGECFDIEAEHGRAR